jgi:hypothetical protein
MNYLYLIFVIFAGIAVIYSISLRMKTIGSEEFRKVLQFTIMLFVAIGIGLLVCEFHKFNLVSANLKNAIFNYSKEFPIMLVVFLFFFSGIIANVMEVEIEKSNSLFYNLIPPTKMIVIFSTFVSMFFLFFITVNGESFYNTIIIQFFVICLGIVFFAVVGIAHAFLGPIISAINISVAIYQIASKGFTIDNILIWSNIFDFFDIPIAIVKVGILFFSTFLGVYDLLALLKENMTDFFN